MWYRNAQYENLFHGKEYKKRIHDRQKIYQELKHYLDKRVQKLGYESYEDFVAKMNPQIRGMLDQSKLFVRTPSDTASKLLDEDLPFKNIFHNQPRRSWYSQERDPYVNDRLDVEKMGMGIPKTYGADRRPIYGYYHTHPGFSNEALEGYGGVAFELKDTVRPYTTLSIGDTFKDEWIPDPETPHASSIIVPSGRAVRYDDPSLFHSLYGAGYVPYAQEDMDETNDLQAWSFGNRNNYIESQIHKKILPSQDIHGTHIKFYYDDWRDYAEHAGEFVSWEPFVIRYYVLELAYASRKRGIPLYLHGHNNQIIVIDKDTPLPTREQMIKWNMEKKPDNSPIIT